MTSVAAQEYIQKTVEEAKKQLEAIEVRAESYTGAMHQWECYQDAQDVALRLLEALDALGSGAYSGSAK